MYLLDENHAHDRLNRPIPIEPPTVTQSSGQDRDLESGQELTPPPSMDHLDALEAQSIYIFREAFARLRKLALLWSLGNDSKVIILLARKTFL